MSDEQEDIIREAAAYRFPHWSIGPVNKQWTLDIRATEPGGNRTVWGPYRLGRGTWTEMNKLRRAAMAKYRLLVKTEKPE